MIAVTVFDVIDAAMVSALAVAVFSERPIRSATASALLAISLFHVGCRGFIFLHGPSGAVAHVAIMATFISACHLLFPYGWRGLATGIAYATIPIFAGFSIDGSLPVVFQAGPGTDFWTLTTLAVWFSQAVLLTDLDWKRAWKLDRYF